VLIQLLSEQIPDYWEDIKKSIAAYDTPLLDNTEEKLNNLLMNMLGGVMQVWVAAEQKEEGTIIQGIIITTVIQDVCSNTKILLIYGGYSVGETSMDSWVEGMRTFNAFGKSKGCTKMGAYTEVEFLKGMLGKLGAQECTYMHWPIV